MSAALIGSIPFLIQLIPEGPTGDVDGDVQYAADVRAAFRIWNENDERIHDNPDAANDIAILLARHAKEQIDRRSFDWQYLWRLCHPAEAVGSLPQLATWQGHESDAYYVTFSRDGSRLASAGRDRTARIWDAMTGQLVCVCSGHANDVNWVDFSPDGSLLATASEDHTVKIWDARTGKELYTLSGHLDEVVATLFAADGKTLVSGDHSGLIKLWDLTAKREIGSIRAHAGASIPCAGHPTAACCCLREAMTAFASGACRNCVCRAISRRLRRRPRRSALMDR